MLEVVSYFDRRVLVPKINTAYMVFMGWEQKNTNMWTNEDLALYHCGLRTAARTQRISDIRTWRSLSPNEPKHLLNWSSLYDLNWVASMKAWYDPITKCYINEPKLSAELISRFYPNLGREILGEDFLEVKKDTFRIKRLPEVLITGNLADTLFLINWRGYLAREYRSLSVISQ